MLNKQFRQFQLINLFNGTTRAKITIKNQRTQAGKVTQADGCCEEDAGG